MSIRMELHGKAVDPDMVYVTPNGVTKRVKRVYAEVNGKTALCWEGPGGRGNPYLISKLEDLALIRQDPSAYFRLARHIDLRKVSTSEIMQYFPLLPPEVPFTGVLDGAGKTIYGASVSATAGKDDIFGALFYENRGTITRLRVAMNPSDVAGGQKAAPFVGINRGVVDQCECVAFSPSFVSSEDAQSAMISTFAAENEGTIQNCRNEMDSGNSDKYSFAGMAFANRGTVTKSISIVDRGTTGRQGKAYSFVFSNEPGGRVTDYCVITAVGKGNYAEVGNSGGMTANVRRKSERNDRVISFAESEFVGYLDTSLWTFAFSFYPELNFSKIIY